MVTGNDNLIYSEKRQNLGKWLEDGIMNYFDAQPYCDYISYCDFRAAAFSCALSLYLFASKTLEEAVYMTVADLENIYENTRE